MTNLRIRKLDEHGILIHYNMILIRFIFKNYDILQGFRSEFWLPALVSNNSDDNEIFQELDDYRIIMKFSKNLIKILEF